MDDQLLEQLRTALVEAEVDAWLLYDFRDTNPLARSVLQLSNRPAGTRRWFYLVKASGSATRIVHGIETGTLDSLAGRKRVYRSWRELHQILKEELSTISTVAMEYAADGNNPYVSRVDAGTIELIRGFGPEIVSSGDLIQRFDATLSQEQWESHLKATEVTTSSFEMAWKLIGDAVRNHGEIEEQAVCDAIMDYFASENMTTYHPPLVARQPHNRLPHYETGTGAETKIRAGDLIMIDQWCKQNSPRAIYSDLTRMAYVGSSVPATYQLVFQVVIDARDRGIQFVRDRCQAEVPIHGWEVDDVVRQVIRDAGYDEAFLHRTGHSLGQEVHGNGAHLDDFEMREERQLIPGSLFTIEPGIYLDEFGFRSEINVFIDADLEVHVTGGPPQSEIQLIEV